MQVYHYIFDWEIRILRNNTRIGHETDTIIS